ncbi:DUF4260 domain-containing protein [soil metagenome]
MVASLTRPAVLLRVEGAALLALSVLFYSLGGVSWTLFLLLVLAPDLSMLGYLKGSRVGALSYNLGHTYLPPAVLVAFGVLAGRPLYVSLGLIWFAHIGFDRMMGFGLKYPTGFGDTHLGRISGV